MTNHINPISSSPHDHGGPLITLTLFSQGTVINSSIQISSVEVHHEVNRISTAIVELIDGDMATQDFPASNSSDFIPGNTIKITAGYDSVEKTIFEGIIIKQAVKCQSMRSCLMTFECKSNAIKMTIGRKNAIFTNTTDSSIIEAVTGNYGLSATIESTSNQLKEVVQYYATDWDFILSRAEINGMFVFPNGSGINVNKPNLGGSPVLTVGYGESIHEFDIETDAPTLDVAIKSWADAQLMKSGLARIRGTISFQGSSLIMPGNLLGIDGVGDRFSGNAFVGAVTHTIRDGDWVTETEIGLPQGWHMEHKEAAAPMASGLFVTRSKLKIIMDDDKKITTIQTPANNQIVISDDAKSILISDQNNNTIELNTGGISLNSATDITISAKGKISVSAVQEIELTAQADVKVTGLNINNTANVGFVGKGNASAELSASGQTTVKGAIVMIN